LLRILGEDVHLRLDLHTRPLWIRADAGMVEQVLMNLSVNARDAMPNGGRLSVVTGERELGASDPSKPPSAAPGRYVWMSLTDNGCGIAPEILPNIFEPFFTTKELSKGTGLGLATVYGIVEQHQGWIDVQSQVGQGSTFQVFLPIGDVDKRSAEWVDTRDKPRGGSETILLVEDDESLRRVARRILVRHGYHVLEAAHGREAIAVTDGLRNSAQPSGGPPGVDLLLTDMVLPEGIGGIELAQRMRAVLPRLKVVYISGYAAELAGRSLALEAGEAFIQKPFRTDLVLGTIRQCLDD
jgi:two-component system, cell cycle sensor histidine kinase and response regulator CckA